MWHLYSAEQGGALSRTEGYTSWRVISSRDRQESRVWVFGGSRCILTCMTASDTLSEMRTDTGLYSENAVKPAVCRCAVMVAVTAESVNKYNLTAGWSKREIAVKKRAKKSWRNFRLIFGNSAYCKEIRNMLQWSVRRRICQSFITEWNVNKTEYEPQA